MNDLYFTPEQCEAGRALLAMSRSDLADLSGVALPFIKRFESRIDHTFASTEKPAQTMIAALIGEGCIFSNMSGVHLKGAPVVRVLTDLEQRYVDGKKVRPEHLSATDFERIGKHVSTEYFIFDEKLRTAYVELELHTGASPSASHKSQVLNNDALPFGEVRKTLRARAYLDAFFTLKHSGHIA